MSNHEPTTQEYLVRDLRHLIERLENNPVMVADIDTNSTYNAEVKSERIEIQLHWKND